MGLFGIVRDPPPLEAGALAYVLWLAQDVHGCADADQQSSLAHELGIYGMDLDDFAQTLAERYGAWVWKLPWSRFDRRSNIWPAEWLKVPILGPILALWLARERSEAKLQSAERLELSHIAKVLEAGEWIEP